MCFICCYTQYGKIKINIMIEKHIELRELINKIKKAYNCVGYSDLLKIKDLCVELDVCSENDFNKLIFDDLFLMHVFERNKLSIKEQRLYSNEISKLSGTAYRKEYEYQQMLKEAQK